MSLRKKINGSRRSPLAAIFVIATGLLFSGGGFAVATNVVESNVATSYTADQIAEGKKLFLSNCASCHGLQGEGLGSNPTLIGVGALAVDFQVASGRMPGQASGPQLAKKPVQFTEEQIELMAAYVASLGVGPAIPEEKYLEATGDVTHGGELFRINCAMCHNAVGAGGALTEGKYAPALTGVSAKHVYGAMATGPQNMPKFDDTYLSPTDKQDIISYLAYIDANQSAGGYALASLGPVAEGLFIWIFGLGGIIAITVWLAAKSN